MAAFQLKLYLQKQEADQIWPSGPEVADPGIIILIITPSKWSFALTQHCPSPRGPGIFRAACLCPPILISWQLGSWLAHLPAVSLLSSRSSTPLCLVRFLVCSGLVNHISKPRLDLKQESVGSAGESFGDQQCLVSALMVLATTGSAPHSRRQRGWMRCV